MDNVLLFTAALVSIFILGFVLGLGFRRCKWLTTTQETYEHLIEAHGITNELCKHCLNRDVEVYQCPLDKDEKEDWASCYLCWCKLVEPKIQIPPEDEGY